MAPNLKSSRVGLALHILPYWAVCPSEGFHLFINRLCSSGVISRHCLLNISSHGWIFQHLSSSCLFDKSVLSVKYGQPLWDTLWHFPSTHDFLAFGKDAKTHVQVEANQYIQFFNSGVNIAVTFTFSYPVQICFFHQ